MQQSLPIRKDSPLLLYHPPKKSPYRLLPVGVISSPKSGSRWNSITDYIEIRTSARTVSQGADLNVRGNFNVRGGMQTSTIITKFHASQILDSRGNPAIEVEVRLADDLPGRAAVPSGASTESREAHELRRGGKDQLSLAK